MFDEAVVVCEFWPNEENEIDKKWEGEIGGDMNILGLLKSHLAYQDKSHQHHASQAKPPLPTKPNQ